jgi:hypothetical protein
LRSVAAKPSARGLFLAIRAHERSKPAAASRCDQDEAIQAGASDDQGPKKRPNKQSSRPDQEQAF